MNDISCGQNSEIIFKVDWWVFLVRKEDVEPERRNKWVAWCRGSCGEWHTVLGCAFGAGQASLCFLKTWGHSSNNSFTRSSLSPVPLGISSQIIPVQPQPKRSPEAPAHLAFFPPLVAPWLSCGSPPGMPPASVLCLPLPS